MQCAQFIERVGSDGIWLRESVGRVMDATEESLMQIRSLVPRAIAVTS